MDIRTSCRPGTMAARLGMGAIALALLLIAEFALIYPVRGVSIKEYLATRDPVSGTVYYAMLGLFALMPLLFGRRDPRASARNSFVPPRMPHPRASSLEL